MAPSWLRGLVDGAGVASFVLGDPKVKTSLTSEDGLNHGRIPMPTFAPRPLTTSSTMSVEFPQNSMVGQQRQQISELQFDRFPKPSSFLVWKTRVKTQVSSGSDFPSEAMLWIKEVEMVESVDEQKILTISIWKKFSKI